jgi:hypothetical protein
MTPNSTQGDNGVSKLSLHPEFWTVRSLGFATFATCGVCMAAILIFVFGGPLTC